RQRQVVDHWRIPRERSRNGERCWLSFKKGAADVAAAVEKIGQACRRNSRINDGRVLAVPVRRSLFREPGSLELDQTAAVGRSDSLGPADDVQFAENTSQVRLYRGFTDEEVRGDFFVASPASKTFEDIDFTAR